MLHGFDVMASWIFFAISASLVCLWVVLGALIALFRVGAGESGRSSFRSSSRVSEVSCSSMKVVLPDSSELELPDGATGLDAATAIGPKLAQEAVLVRANGRVQDLRLPLEDGQPIQILTTRDTDDPDALYVLRHSAAHLLAEA